MQFTTVGLFESLLLLPMTVIFLFACIPITIKVLNKNKEPSNNLTIACSVLGLILAAVLTRIQGVHLGPVFFGALIFDKMAVFLNYGILAVGMMTLLMSQNNVNTSGQSLAEHAFLILSSITGMMILASASELIVLFVGLELMSLALYVLIALGHEQKFSKEAAFKYFILGSFASSILLFGIAFLFGATGTTELPLISARAPALMGSNIPFVVGICLLIVGLAFKTSIFPFHAWTPDVYQGAPTPVSAFMATAVKLVMFGVFLRLASQHLFSQNQQLVFVLEILAIATMTVGNISALLQENIKRIVAYSSVAHAGYIMIGIIAATNAATAEAGAATLFYLLSYSVMNIGAFAVISLIEKEERGHQNIADYSGLGFKYPFLGAAMSVFMLALAGMPPTVGFIAKFYVFSAAMKEGYTILALFGVINSLLSAYYYLRVIVNMYMKEPGHNVVAQKAYLTRGVVMATLVLTFVFGIVSTNLYKPAFRSVSTFFAGR